jgi:lactoylglutathione lyase
MGRAYNLGDNEFHLAFCTDDAGAALAKHKAMGCVVFENTALNVYFIADPDGYLTDIIPSKGNHHAPIAAMLLRVFIEGNDD